MYYRIPDEEAERSRENCTNAVKRHCRIGKVSAKLPPHWEKLALGPWFGKPKPSGGK